MSAEISGFHAFSPKESVDAQLQQLGLFISGTNQKCEERAQHRLAVEFALLFERFVLTSRNSSSGGWEMGFVRRGGMISRERFEKCVANL